VRPDCGVALGGRRSSIRPGQGPRGAEPIAALPRHRRTTASMQSPPSWARWMHGGKFPHRSAHPGNDGHCSGPLARLWCSLPHLPGLFPSERLIRDASAGGGTKSGVRDAMVLVRLAERADEELLAIEAQSCPPSSLEHTAHSCRPPAFTSAEKST